MWRIRHALLVLHICVLSFGQAINHCLKGIRITKPWGFSVAKRIRSTYARFLWRIKPRNFWSYTSPNTIANFCTIILTFTAMNHPCFVNIHYTHLQGIPSAFHYCLTMATIIHFIAIRDNPEPWLTPLQLYLRARQRHASCSRPAALQQKNPVPEFQRN